MNTSTCSSATSTPSSPSSSTSSTSVPPSSTPLSPSSTSTPLSPSSFATFSPLVEPSTKIDLSDPHALRRFVGTTRFITEFTNDVDSDVDLCSSSEEDQDSGDDSSEDESPPPEDIVTSGDWRMGCSTPEDIPFDQPAGLRVEMDDTTPQDYFHLMFDHSMLEHIVVETNRYAHDCLDGKELPPRSRFRKWVKTTLGELKAFLGLIIAMGLIKLEDMDDYWSHNKVFDLPLFRSIMTRDRFMLLLSFLHASDNSHQLPREHPQYDPLNKIRHFIESLKTNFQRVFMPGKLITIDEAMIAWRGHLAFRVYNPAKPVRYGIKMFALCDSKTGFCSNFELYTGRTETTCHGATFDIVNRLITPYLDAGRILYCDNFYTKPDLFSYLKERKTLACGTMRINRIGGPPKSMIQRLTKRDTPKVLTNGTLNLLKFFDKREVNMLTTAHDASRVFTGRLNRVTGEPIIKFEAVDQYNKFMGAVDRSDQMMTYNAFKRRTIKWWKKAFFHMYMLSVLNAYLVQKAHGVTKLCHRSFRRHLVEQLVEWTPIPRRLRPAAGSSVEVGDCSLLRLVGRHFIQPIPRRSATQSKYPQRDCIVCTRKTRRMQSRYECPSCDVGLHIHPCFKIYHTCKDYKRALKRAHEDRE